jgi:hypothetical protein
MYQYVYFIVNHNLTCGIYYYSKLALLYHSIIDTIWFQKVLLLSLLLLITSNAIRPSSVVEKYSE